MKVVITAAIAIAIASPAYAQVAPGLPSRQELQPGRTAPMTSPIPRDSSGLFEQLPGGPCGFADSSLSFTLTEVVLDGGPAEWATVTRDIWADRIGQNLPVGELCIIRDQIAAALLARNQLARVEIPRQRIEDGRVRFEVIPGRFELVRISGDTPASSLVRRTLEPVTRAERIDLDVVQRYLLLAADIPGVRLKPLILPGATRGGLVLEVQVERRPIDLAMGVQNLNSRSQGRVTGFARFALQGLTGAGDRTTLLASSSADFHELQVYQIGQEFRLGSQGLVARGSFTYAIGRPGDRLEPLDLRTRSMLGNVELAYPLIRHRRRNVTLSGGIDAIDQRTRVFETLPLSHERARVAYARVAGNVASRYGDLPAGLAGGFELRKGLDILDATQRGSLDLSRPFANPTATVIRGNVQGQAAVASWVTLAASALAQYADDPVVTYEQLGIGNLSIGRGYDPNAVPGDRGIALSLETQFQPIQRNWVALAPFAFFDVARVTNLGAGGYSDTLRSVGAGVRGRLLDRFDISVAYAHPLDSAFPGGSRADDRVLLSLTATLF